MNKVIKKRRITTFNINNNVKNPFLSTPFRNRPNIKMQEIIDMIGVKMIVR